MGVSNWLIIDFSKYHTIKKNNRLQGLPATTGGFCMLCKSSYAQALFRQVGVLRFVKIHNIGTFAFERFVNGIILLRILLVVDSTVVGK